jgi:hypothetical protein
LFDHALIRFKQLINELGITHGDGRKTGYYVGFIVRPHFTTFLLWMSLKFGIGILLLLY